VLVGPETGDDAGVYLLDTAAGKVALVATADFITPVCDDPNRFGRIAATNAISDVYAMGGRPLFALNLCCFPNDLPKSALAGMLEGASQAMAAAGCALLGGHTVKDKELKYGLAVVGIADPSRLLPNTGARAGDVLLMTKPLGTGVMVNAYKVKKLDAQGLEPALAEMERTNAVASEIALRHGAHAATDVTGFGLSGHALGMAKASKVKLEIRLAALVRHAAFDDLVRRGVSTGSTKPNRDNAIDSMRLPHGLAAADEALLFDPQTSGGLLIALPEDAADAALDQLVSAGHRAARVGRVLEPEPRGPLLEIL
jgi:selenide, water dikinase